MSLACLVCHGVESPSHSFRSYSVSSSDNEGRCSAVANCLTRKTSFPHPRANPRITPSKVMPQPSVQSNMVAGTPRLVRSHAIRRDLVRDWNFDEVMLER
ncbi:uncharacterized protein LOC111390292 [Olea europaea var. sylvestris]|uniref:Uncharacterized protein n=1 Tax=Olea europaea subsp. europaea TaxID=158383 RepID=A0A8S0Q3K2_OLEEU|nr:uncharacterized protein LOC111390292 [Olea europaea var. sylvestris]CAA2960881.1 Hypothetical predicted protein [Olea europaea subsp. europaea]